MRVNRQKIALKKSLHVTPRSVFSLTYVKNTTLLRTLKQKQQLGKLSKYQTFSNGFFVISLTNNLRLQSDFMPKRAKSNEILFPYELKNILFHDRTLLKFEEALQTLQYEQEQDDTNLIEIDYPLLELRRVKGSDVVSRSLSFLLRVSNFHQLHAMTNGTYENETVEPTAQIIMLEKFSEVAEKEESNVICSFTVTSSDMESLLASTSLSSFADSALVENNDAQDGSLRSHTPSEKTLVVYGDGDESEKTDEARAHETIV